MKGKNPSVALEVLAPDVDLDDTGPSLIRPFSVIDIMAGDPPAAPKVLVERFILDEEVNIAAGDGGSLKTGTMLHTALAIATGLPVFGTLRVHRSGTVVVALPEDGQAQGRATLDAFLAGLLKAQRVGRDVAELARLRIKMLPEGEVVLPRDCARLGETMLQHHAVAFIGDPARNLIGDGDENDQALMSSLIAGVREHVCRRAGAAAVLAHHLRKPDRSAPTDSAPNRNDVRGSNSIVNGARLVWAFSKRDSRISIVAVKSNRLPLAGLRHDVDLSVETDPSNAARWLSATLTDANVGATSETLTPGSGRALSANEMAALKAVDDRHEPGSRLSWSRWEKGAGINANTFRSVRERLLDAGLVDAKPTGKTTKNGSREYSYGITDKGRKCLV